MPSETISKGEQTRQQIITAAMRLFLKQGYHGTSMREIAKEADIALGGIYNHFANKEEIFEAVFSAYHPYNQMVPAVMNIHGDTIEEVFHNLAAAIIGSLTSTPDFLNLLFIDMVEFQKTYTIKRLKEQLPLFESIYQQAVENNSNRLRPLPPLIVARSFFGLFFSYYFTEMMLSGATDIPNEMFENAFEYFIDIYLHGILKK
jgi:AcrR family transcriptional regulator